MGLDAGDGGNQGFVTYLGTTYYYAVRQASASFLPRSAEMMNKRARSLSLQNHQRTVVDTRPVVGPTARFFLLVCMRACNWEIDAIAAGS